MLNVNLNHAVIAEIHAHLRRGDMNYLYGLGFSEDELAAIDALTPHEIYDMCESASSFAQIKIDHNAFWGLITNVRENSRQRNIVDKALMLGASSEILNQRFGLSSADVSTRRKLLGISEPMGRKKNCSEEEEQRIWAVWQQHKTADDDLDTDEGLELLMFIATQVNVSLTEVHRLVYQWHKETGSSR